MLKIFRNKELNRYDKLIKSAFPSVLSKDVETVISILPLKDKHVILCDGQTHKVEDLIHENFQKVKLDNENLEINYRLYFNEPSIDLEKELTAIQRCILNCIFLRHHNGYIRQKRLENLNGSKEYFVTPFVFQLLGEYVIEIVEVIDKQNNNIWLKNFAKFVNENPKYWIQTESRMISYWNEYYRRPKIPNLKDYVGYKVVKKIKGEHTTRYMKS